MNRLQLVLFLLNKCFNTFLRNFEHPHDQPTGWYFIFMQVGSHASYNAGHGKTINKRTRANNEGRDPLYLQDIKNILSEKVGGI